MSMPAPPPPTNVRLVVDGREIPLELEYDGQTETGAHRWRTTSPIDVSSGWGSVRLASDELPPDTTLEVGWRSAPFDVPPLYWDAVEPQTEPATSRPPAPRGRAGVDDFLAWVDEVTTSTCGACTFPLDPAGPSPDFCDDLCQASWHRTQAEPLHGYREPWHRPHDFPGVGGEAFRPNAPAVEDRLIQPFTAPPLASGFNLGIGDSGSAVYVRSSNEGEWQPIGHTRRGDAVRFVIHDETRDAGGRGAARTTLYPRAEFREYTPPPAPDPPVIDPPLSGVRVSWDPDPWPPPQ